MCKVKNWTRTQTRNVSDVGMCGIVREWEHDETDQTVSICYIDENDGYPAFYDVQFGDESVTGFDTLTEACEDVVYTLRQNPNGWDA